METRNDFVRALGIVPGIRAPARLNFAGWAELEPRRYGRMEFRFADRAVPGLFERDRDPPVSHPAPLDYVARAIEEARKSGRVLVQCTSYALVGELAVLPTPAAWSGVSLPGLVDHVVIPGSPSVRTPCGTRPRGASSRSWDCRRLPRSSSSPATGTPRCAASSLRGLAAGSRDRARAAPCGSSIRDFRCQSRWPGRSGVPVRGGR